MMMMMASNNTIASTTEVALVLELEDVGSASKQKNIGKVDINSSIN